MVAEDEYEEVKAGQDPDTGGDACFLPHLPCKSITHHATYVNDGLHH